MTAVRSARAAIPAARAAAAVALRQDRLAGERKGKGESQSGHQLSKLHGPSYGRPKPTVSNMWPQHRPRARPWQARSPCEHRRVLPAARRTKGESAYHEGMARALTFADHDRGLDGNRYVYAVLSRRARGLSIGVNLNPDKVCNFDCPYCQVDRTTPGGPAEIDVDVLVAELEALLERARSGALWQDPLFATAPDAMRRVADVAFAGDGEPTTPREFPAAAAGRAGRDRPQRLRRPPAPSDQRHPVRPAAGPGRARLVRRALVQARRGHGAVLPSRGRDAPPVPQDPRQPARGGARAADRHPGHVRGHGRHGAGGRGDRRLGGPPAGDRGAGRPHRPRAGVHGGAPAGGGGGWDPSPTRASPGSPTARGPRGWRWRSTAPPSTTATAGADVRWRGPAAGGGTSPRRGSSSTPGDGREHRGDGLRRDLGPRPRDPFGSDQRGLVVVPVDLPERPPAERASLARVPPGEDGAHEAVVRRRLEVAEAHLSAARTSGQREQSCRRKCGRPRAECTAEYRRSRSTHAVRPSRGRSRGASRAGRGGARAKCPTRARRAPPRRRGRGSRPGSHGVLLQASAAASRRDIIRRTAAPSSFSFSVCSGKRRGLRERHSSGSSTRLTLMPGAQPMGRPFSMHAS